MRTQLLTAALARDARFQDHHRRAFRRRTDERARETLYEPGVQRRCRLCPRQTHGIFVGEIQATRRWATVPDYGTDETPFAYEAGHGASVGTKPVTWRSA